MKALAAVRAELDRSGVTRLTQLRSQTPLLLRPARTLGLVHLVGGAGGPLGGDELRLEIEVGPGADLTVSSIAASLPQAGNALRPSKMTISVHVGTAGTCQVLMEPTVIANGANHELKLIAIVDGGARLVVREELILGRHGQLGGAVKSHLAVDVEGIALLRQEIKLSGLDRTSCSAATVNGRRCTGNLIIVDPDWLDPSQRHKSWSTTWAVGMALDGPGFLITAIADDATVLRKHLDRKFSKTTEPLSTY